MKKYIYSYRNIAADCFAKPFIEDVEPENFSMSITEGLKVADIKILESLISDDLFYLGYFDTLTGEFTTAKEFLVHVGDLARQLIEAKKMTEKKDA